MIGPIIAQSVLRPIRIAGEQRWGGEEMMTAKTGGIPRYRPWQGPALLQQGFRPFFLGAGIWAATALGLWLATLNGRLVLPSAFDPVAWHAHEMLFGFAGAAVAGFLLTAVPNWTGRMPRQGLPLAGLALLWLAGRVAVALSQLTGPLAAAALDLAFPAVLLGAILREIWPGATGAICRSASHSAGSWRPMR